MNSFTECMETPIRIYYIGGLDSVPERQVVKNGGLYGTVGHTKRTAG